MAAITGRRRSIPKAGQGNLPGFLISNEAALDYAQDLPDGRMLAQESKLDRCGLHAFRLSGFGKTFVSAPAIDLPHPLWIWQFVRMPASGNSKISRWWIHGLGGVALGAFCQYLVSGEARSKPTKSRPPVAGHATRGDGKRRMSGKPAPGMMAMREAAVADAWRCEALALEIIEARDPSRAAELEVVFRRWMSFEKPSDVLERLDASIDPKVRSRWSGAFFDAWAVTDYRQAMSTPTPDGSYGDRFEKERAVAAVEHLDPDFIKYLKNQNLRHSGKERLGVALRALGKDHPELARTVSPSDLQQWVSSGVMKEIMRGWASADPASALA